MILIEKHIIKQSHPFFNECDSLCFKSKNIYNQALYNVRQYYFENKKYLTYVNNYHLTTKQECYNYLPTKVFCQTLKMVDNNFKSFFSLLKNKTVINKIPKYLDKDGRFICKFPKQALGLKIFKQTSKIHLSQTNINIQTKLDDFNIIKEVRIVPSTNQYIIEVVYEKKVKELKSDNNRYCSIDLGINNLATVTSNVIKPFIINGKPLKSINQYYNKRISKLKSKLVKGQKTSHRIQRLTNKRNNKINDYLHKHSRYIVNHLVSNNINTLVIGYNKNWKQDINIGKVNNQKFVNIPFLKFINLLNYKCELEGIRVIINEESYTSKCSFLDNEEICKHDVYKGKRIKRGLYKSNNGKLINSDVNGSLNILRKVFPNINLINNGIEVIGVSPMVLTIKE